MFNVKASYAHQEHIFTLIKSKQLYCKILSQFSWYCFILEYIPIIPLMYSFDGRLISPVFSLTWSFRNPSNMLIYDYYQC